MNYRRRNIHTDSIKTKTRKQKWEEKQLNWYFKWETEEIAPDVEHGHKREILRKKLNLL